MPVQISTAVRVWKSVHIHLQSALCSSQMKDNTSHIKMVQDELASMAPYSLVAKYTQNSVLLNHLKEPLQHVAFSVTLGSLVNSGDMPGIVKVAAKVLIDNQIAIQTVRCFVRSSFHHPFSNMPNSISDHWNWAATQTPSPFYCYHPVLDHSDCSSGGGHEEPETRDDRRTNLLQCIWLSEEAACCRQFFTNSDWVECE